MKNFLMFSLLVSIVVLVVFRSPKETNEFRKNFVLGCTGEGGSGKFCGCMYDRLEVTYGAEGILRESIQLEKGNPFSKEFDELVIKAAVYCK